MNEPAPKISDRDQALNAMKQLMEEVLFTHRGNELLQRTSCYRKLQGLANKAGVELLEWIKLYTIENNPETVPIIIPSAADTDTIYAIETLAKIMETYSDNARKRGVYLKHQGGYNSLIRFSFRARVPLIEWIVNYYKTAISDLPLPLPYKCPVPECTEAFSTLDGLRGHGPNRCRAKYAKKALTKP